MPRPPHRIAVAGPACHESVQQGAAVPGRARILGSWTCVSPNSRPESNKGEKKNNRSSHGFPARVVSGCPGPTEVPRSYETAPI